MQRPGAVLHHADLLQPQSCDLAAAAAFHCCGQTAMLAEVRRGLRPGGALLAYTDFFRTSDRAAVPSPIAAPHPRAPQLQSTSASPPVGDDLSYEHAEYLFKRHSPRISRDGLPCISSGTWP